MKTSKILHILVLAVALLAVGQIALATNWSVTYSGGKFVITRDNTVSATKVQYRTVNVTAMAGKHYIGVSGTLTFAAGESSKEVSVSERAITEVPLRYRYQCTHRLYYAFEVMDPVGDRLAIYRKSIDTGDQYNNQYYLKNLTDFLNDGNIRDLTYFNEHSVASGLGAHYHDEFYTPPTSEVEGKGTYQGYVLIDDSYDYKYRAATVTPGFLFVMNRAGATGEWHKLAGNKLLASVVFTEKEKDDGYAYVQILIGDRNTAYDEGADPNGEVNKPVNSIYKACFELKKGSGAYGGHGKWIFPHTYDHHNALEEYKAIHQLSDHTAFWTFTGSGEAGYESYLWQQKFRDEGYRAGRFNNAFVLDPDISGLTVRFDCGGKDDDTYGYKDLFVRWALVDDTAPTVIKEDITVNPGLHAKGNIVTITVPFSEPVHLDHGHDRYILHTSWGGLVADADCDNNSVVTFSGKITANPGTALVINSLETTYNPTYGSSAPIRPIADMMGHEFGGDVAKSLNYTVDAIYNIHYNLREGSVAGENPSKYTQNSPSFTLINPTRDRYVFTGWTGTDLNGPTKTVTVPTGSTGDRYYYANWEPDYSLIGSGDGSKENPFIIMTPSGLDYLAFFVEEGYVFQYKYFELGADLDMSGIPSFNGIGTRTKKFYGIFDGKGHTISRFTITANGQDESGLFRYKDTGSLKNIAVAYATISGARYVGAILGYSSVISLPGCSVTNCTISSSVDSGDSFVGGIAGRMVNADVPDGLVSGCTISGSGGTLYLGGVVGYSGTSYTARSIRNNLVVGCTLDGTAASESYLGTIVGWLNGDGSNTGGMSCPNNFVYNTKTSGTPSLYGKLHQKAYANGSHYRSLTCGTAAPVSDVFTISAGAEFVVSATPAITYAGTDYYAEGTEVLVSAAPGHTLGSVSYSVAGGSASLATDNGKGSWSFPMPAGDATIQSGDPISALSLTWGVKDGVGAYWATFYHGVYNYMLTEGAAYTMGTDYKLYRLGTDGRTIPKGVAVVIISSIPGAGIVTAGTGDLGITDNAPAPGGNQLRGSDTAVSVVDIGGNPYVLTIDNDTDANIGFRKFSDSTIPANKAYYIK